MREAVIEVIREQFEQEISVVAERFEALIGVEPEQIERIIDVVPEALTITIGDLPRYTGATEVNPDFEGITLPTRNTSVYANIDVNAIQVESVSNPSGGTTVYIGGI